MSVWRPTSVDETPAIEISRWTIREVTKSKYLDEGLLGRHIVGLNLTEGGGRVSSKIESFDKETMIATTNSGRKYHLRADPCINMDAEYVFSAWCQHNEVDEWMDVSDDYYQDDPLEDSFDQIGDDQ